MFTSVDANSKIDTSGVMMGVHIYLLRRFELLGTVYLVQQTISEIRERTPRLSSEWARDIPNEFEKRECPDPILVCSYSY